MVELDKEQKRQALAIEAQQEQIEELKESFAILPSKPANAESITYIRARIGKYYGFPARIVNEVLYSAPYAPRPAGEVRNTHENANSSTYTVWYATEVTKLFKRFDDECEQVTKTQAVHPMIDGRFKRIGGDV